MVEETERTQNETFSNQWNCLVKHTNNLLQAPFRCCKKEKEKRNYMDRDTHVTFFSHKKQKFSAAGEITTSVKDVTLLKQTIVKCCKETEDGSDDSHEKTETDRCTLFSRPHRHFPWLPLRRSTVTDELFLITLVNARLYTAISRCRAQRSLSFCKRSLCIFAQTAAAKCEPRQLAVYVITVANKICIIAIAMSVEAIPM